MATKAPEKTTRNIINGPGEQDLSLSFFRRQDVKFVIHLAVENVKAEVTVVIDSLKRVAGNPLPWIEFEAIWKVGGANQVVTGTYLYTGRHGTMTFSSPPD
ncbi:MAG TPA: hypothetical protein VLE93_00505 [Candidatus Saccharimonadales bacterium]|nr:hypothetical protein [Candidatus Saccharimonadales bacterium]